MALHVYATTLRLVGDAGHHGGAAAVPPPFAPPPFSRGAGAGGGAGGGAGARGGAGAGRGAGAGAAPSPQDIAWAAQFPSMSVAGRRALQEGGLNMATAKLLVDELHYKHPDDLRVRGGWRGVLRQRLTDRAWRGKVPITYQDRQRESECRKLQLCICRALLLHICPPPCTPVVPPMHPSSAPHAAPCTNGLYAPHALFLLVPRLLSPLLYNLPSSPPSPSSSAMPTLRPSPPACKPPSCPS